MGQASVPANARQPRAPRKSRDRKPAEGDTSMDASMEATDRSVGKGQTADAKMLSSKADRTLPIEASLSSNTDSAAHVAATAVKSEHTQSPAPESTSATSETAPDASGAPARRQTTRMRKPSSRLLPSPSPPPPQRSSYYNYLNKSNSSTSLTGSQTSSGSGKARKSQSTEPRSVAGPTMDVSTADAASSDAVVDEALAKDAAEAADGKRKRRPSTMTKPPSTITGMLSPTPALAAALPTAAPTKTKQKTVVKEEMGDESSVKQSIPKASRKPKATKLILRREDDNDLSESMAPTATCGYDSDGNTEGALLHSLAGPDADDGGDEDSDSGLQSKPSKRSVLSLARKTLLTSTRARGVSLVDTDSSLEPPPLIPRHGDLKVGQSAMRQVTVKGYPHTTPPSAKHSRWLQHGASQALPLLRFRLDNLDSHADDEDSSAAEDEDDFHVAMLSGCDLDISSDTDMREAIVSPTFKESPRDCQSQDGSDGEYTPATTPQSPRSTCDPTTDRRASVEGETTTTAQALHDAVFAHALEPSSRRPHTHAGLLTLSLPFEESGQAHDEDGNVIAPVQTLKTHPRQPSTSIKEEEQDSESAAVESEMDTTPDRAEHETADTELMSTSSQSLGFSAKHAALVLSSPNPCSAFPSPNVTAMRSFDSSDPGPLLLPTTSAHLQVHLMGKSMSQEMHGGSSRPLRTSSLFSTSALDADTDGETEQAGKLSFGGSLGGFHPPESLCLSELDHAWEMSEGRGIAADMPMKRTDVADPQPVPAVDDGTSPSSEADVEQMMGGETSTALEPLDVNGGDEDATDATLSTPRRTRKAAAMEKMEVRRASKRGRSSTGTVGDKSDAPASSPSHVATSRRPARRSTLARGRA